MVYLREPFEIEAIRTAAQLVTRTLELMGREIRPGRTTGELDRLAETFIRDHGGQPAFKGYRGFPASICPSVNDEVVHAIPGSRELRDGDVIGIDVGVEKDGYFGDAAYTFPVGGVSREAKRLLHVTFEALLQGVSQARAGQRVGDISHAIQTHAEQHGFSVVRADGERGRAGHRHAARRLDGGDEGWIAERAFRAHRRDRPEWPRDPLGQRRVVAR